MLARLRERALLDVCARLKERARRSDCALEPSATASVVAIICVSRQLGASA